MAFDASGPSSPDHSNLPLSDQCSQAAFDAAKTTFRNRQGKWGEAEATLDHFYCQLVKTPSHRLAIASDGIGTKIEVAERCGVYRTLGYDLVAMIVDDIICCGAEPTHISNILDVDKLDREIVNELFFGFKQACDEARIMITGGETAELGSRVGGFGPRMHFNWCATGLGILANEMPLIDGSAIQEGDAVLSLRSCGIRSNGYSLARAVLQTAYGDHWHLESFDEKMTWGNKLLTPSRIYAHHVSHVLALNMPIRGIAHITGGGLAANFERILQAWGKGAFLDTLQSPHSEMLRLQDLGGLSDREVYETWNMGNGMLLVLEPSSVEAVLAELRERNVPAQKAGVITNKPQIELVSKAKEASRLLFSYQE